MFSLRMRARGPGRASGHAVRERKVSFEYAPHQLALVILCFCYAAWIVLPSAGMLFYDGQTVKSKELPLYYFDRFFRSFGSIIVLGVIALRALATLAIPEAFPAPQLAVPAALYASNALIRAALYGLHEAGLMFNPRRWPEEVEEKAPHIMSDHILLAASTVAGLASEAMLPLLSVKSTTSRRGRAFIMLHVFLATLLAVLVSAESYFTTRYFHPPLENFIGLVVGFVLFQAPMLLFNLKCLHLACIARMEIGPQDGLETSHSNGQLDYALRRKA